MASQNERRNGGIINPLFDGLTYNTSGHFAHCSYFSSPLRGSEKYYATRKISARIICYTIEQGVYISVDDKNAVSNKYVVFVEHVSSRSPSQRYYLSKTPLNNMASSPNNSKLNKNKLIKAQLSANLQKNMWRVRSHLNFRQI